MVDIRELARRSGVSAATVSRALNDRADVSPTTRARILELAAELGYSPSQPARTLVRKRSDTVGLIWDTGYERTGRRHPFLQDLLTALKRPLSLMPASERLAGYRYASARLGLPYRPEYVVHGDFFLDSGYQATRQLLALPEPPDAIFAAGDEMAIGTLHAIFDAGLTVPEDIAVVGFDDIEAACLVRPALTTVAQSPSDLCTSAVKALLSIIADGDHASLQPGVLPTRLVVRQSSGSPGSRTAP
ncbi:MAG TPA: LacI family DNA-binding transcriptional regulator, partial [Rugosimonospora sp.]|nr:LacI family DNA-binding transcriptional regulator [Rugosimonospora sp.]